MELRMREQQDSSFVLDLQEAIPDLTLTDADENGLFPECK